MDDEMLSFSGEIPDEFNATDHFTMDTVLNDTYLTNVTLSELTSTTFATLLPYSPNYYRIGIVTVKCLLSLLILALSATIRKDFLKHFTLFLMIPIVFEIGFDIYTEIKASITSYGSRIFQWQFSTGVDYNAPAISLQHESLNVYKEVLSHYTTYNIYSSTTSFALICYILSDILFWSILFTSVVTLYYAHKAIVRPEEISYIPYTWSFLKVQLFPILFTVLDTLITTFEIPYYIEVGSMSIIRCTACLVAVTLLTQMLAVRDGKWRLLSFILFQVVVHILTGPYLFWSAISLAEDFLTIFNFSPEYINSLPLHYATDMFTLHITCFLLRPLVLLVAVVLLLTPYRKRFLSVFCLYCRRNT
ncbi:hypothetical protein DICVIV_04979 [Dictyocaulus viviparus]|uniref:Uncharacterized protein n=1 Tax=Dictyocaulus viviparus TaxID=29172 RepID=A0A0D8XYR9_DICVI|nr:hypothetical protein DICVIV_04979 [Dictyocaulus viviparus]